MPQHLRFFLAKEWTDAGKGKPPPDQHALMSEFEDLARDVRQTLKDEAAELESSFRRVLAGAQGTFSPHGFLKKAGQDAIAQERQELAKHVDERRRKLELRLRELKRGYFIWSAITMCIAMAVVAAVSYGLLFVTSSHDMRTSISAMRMLLCGAMIGLTIAMLLRLEDPAEENPVHALEVLPPMWTRLFLYGLVIVVLGFVLDQGWMEVKLGEASSKAIHTSPGAALLFGVLLGGAQKALPALYNRLSESVAKFLGEAVTHGRDRTAPGAAGPRQRRGGRATGGQDRG
ncbi:membrane hypothetical protein [Paraburkholderia ribeironis]|uniref:Uncharacterized protein n=1 Tax=Paraburkholderia ribeironis TaxID=1247936 RepID=A0A1N7SNT1_9BURK|nr:hypothetical protein [Paraburkholderia ribeironis]SIT49083.1 membrane hypothetical protein [Paraburkholderia ribeironis]